LHAEIDFCYEAGPCLDIDILMHKCISTMIVWLLIYDDDDFQVFAS